MNTGLFSNVVSWIWVGAMVVFVIIEAMTVALTTIWAAIASFVMIFLSRTGMSLAWQILLFLVMTIGLLLTTRPLLKKKLKNKTATNFDAIINQEVVVVKKVSKFKKGEAKSKNGVIWTATSVDDLELEVSTVAIVTGVEGNTLILKKKEL